MTGRPEAGFDPENRTAVRHAAQAMRQIITSEVVHQSRIQTRRLIEDHSEAHYTYLAYSAATFVWHHATDCVGPELAEDRFYYLLTRIGELNELVAREQCADPVERLLVLLDLLDRALADTRAESDPGRTDEALAAAQTCLVAHHFVRSGRPPWGIQDNLDRDDMLVLNDALGKVLVIMTIAAVDPDRRLCHAVVESLLGDACRILAAQARAAEVSVEDLVAQYFCELSLRDALEE